MRVTAPIAFYKRTPDASQRQDMTLNMSCSFTPGTHIHGGPVTLRLRPSDDSALAGKSFVIGMGALEARELSRLLAHYADELEAGPCQTCGAPKSALVHAPTNRHGHVYCYPTNEATKQL